jgi:alpha-tubulin suppressor-like RCC1 family protein
MRTYADVCRYSHAVALLKTEQIYSWGRNDSGQVQKYKYGRSCWNNTDAAAWYIHWGGHNDWGACSAYVS